MKESEVIRAIFKVEDFLNIVKLILSKGAARDARETAKALRRPCEQGEHAVVCAKALCEYVADTKDTKRLQRLRELGEMAEKIMMGEHGTWPLSRPLQGWQARFSLLNMYVEEIQQNIAFWVQNMREDTQGGEASATEAQGGATSAADAQGGATSTAHAKGGEASASQQARVIDREGIKEMFMKGSESQRKAEAFVVNLEKLAENGEKDKAFAMCAANMHKQLSHNALLPKFQAWAKLWRALKILIGATAKGYENQREKLLKKAKK